MLSAVLTATLSDSDGAVAGVVASPYAIESAHTALQTGKSYADRTETTAYTMPSYPAPTATCQRHAARFAGPVHSESHAQSNKYEKPCSQSAACSLLGQ